MATNVINIADFKIEVSSKMKANLSKIFKCSKETVRLALEYRSNSKTAVSIRNKTKELLQKEIEKIDNIKTA